MLPSQILSPLPLPAPTNNFCVTLSFLCDRFAQVIFFCFTCWSVDYTLPEGLGVMSFSFYHHPFHSAGRIVAIQQVNVGKINAFCYFV